MLEDGTWVISASGYGPLRIGERVSKEMQADFEGNWECIGPRYWDGDQEITELATEDGTYNTAVVGLKAMTPDVVTDAGITLGATREEVLAAYPDATDGESYEDYDGSSADVIIAAVEGKGGLYLELENGAVTMMSAQHADFYYPAGMEQICGGP